MSLNRTTTWTAVLAGVFLMALPASGQGLQDVQLFSPAEFSSYGGGVRPKEGFFFSFDLLYWSTSAPEGGPIGDPGAGTLKFYGPHLTDAVVQTNSLDTSVFTQQWENGERFEIGDRWRHHGWMLGTLRLKSNSSNVITANGVSMNWIDPAMGPTGRHRLEGYYLYDLAGPVPVAPAADLVTVTERDPEGTPPDLFFPSIITIGLGGVVIITPGAPIPIPGTAVPGSLPAVLRELPVVFDDVKVKNKNDMWGTELMYSYRTHPQHHGGFFELFFGARYLEYNDLFSVDARNRIPGEPDNPAEDDERVPYWTPGASLANSNWSTTADNHIVGPQVALRWFRTSERWTLDTSGRFVAGFNNQNIFQQGTLGSEWYPGIKYTSDIDEDLVDMQGRPLLMAKSSFTHQDHSVEWSPIVELRLNLQYQLTRGISIHGGWTGMWIDGIARGSSLNVYRLPDMGLDMSENRQDVIVHGFNGGVQMNY